MTDFHFIRPGWLLLLPVCVLLWWVWRGTFDSLRGWRSQIDPELLKVITVNTASRRDLTPVLLITVWILAVIAISGPTWQREPNPFASDEVPLLILLKADHSMDQPVPAPAPLERARLKIADIAELRIGQPLGLIAYSGSAHLVLPPTKDTSIVAQMAAEISSDVMPQDGDRLDLAIQKGGKLLQEMQQGGTLLVITNDVTTSMESLKASERFTRDFAVQFLALEDQSHINSAADALGARINKITPDDQDVTAIVKAAARSNAVGLHGQSDRWQEAGFWLVPMLTLCVLAQFRRKNLRTGKEGL